SPAGDRSAAGTGGSFSRLIRSADGTRVTPVLMGLWRGGRPLVGDRPAGRAVGGCPAPQRRNGIGRQARAGESVVVPQAGGVPGGEAPGGELERGLSRTGGGVRRDDQQDDRLAGRKDESDQTRVGVAEPADAD